MMAWTNHYVLCEMNSMFDRNIVQQILNYQRRALFYVINYIHTQAPPC